MTMASSEMNMVVHDINDSNDGAEMHGHRERAKILALQIAITIRGAPSWFSEEKLDAVAAVREPKPPLRSATWTRAQALRTIRDD